MKNRTSENSKKIYDFKVILCGLLTGFIIAAPPMALLWWVMVLTESMATSDKVITLIGAVLLTFAVVRIAQYTHSILRRIEKKLENRAC